jgi:hypothetical protein
MKIIAGAVAEWNPPQIGDVGRHIEQFRFIEDAP